MISDLTKIKLKTLNKHIRIDTYFLFNSVERGEDEESFYRNAFYNLILTGDKEQRRQKRRFKFSQDYQCQSCGKFYTHRAWLDNQGLCPNCIKEKPVFNLFHLTIRDRTQRIRDLWNRCY